MIDIARWGSARLGSAEGGAQRELSPWLLNRRGIPIDAVSLAVPISTATIAHGNSRERIMYHFATASFAGIIATVLVSGIAFMPTPAEAAKMSNAERVALEKATAACKVEAKGMKFSWHWRKRQKYVQNCIIRTVNQEGVSIDIWQVRSTVNMKGLRPQRPGEWGCDPMC